MDQLIDLKAYIASTVVWVPVIVAIIAAAASITCVVLNNRNQQKMTYRKERVEAYRNLLTTMFASLVNSTKNRGTDLNYDELCLCYSNYEFWTTLATVQLLGTLSVRETCGELHRVLAKEKVVSKDRLLELFAILHQQMIDDVNETLNEKKRF